MSINDKKRILIADPSHEMVQKILSAEEASHYEIETASTGPECESKLSDFQPELIVIDLMLPTIHGIEILNQLRETPETRKIGVIITSFNVIVQNYHAAIDAGADDFLVKPFETSELFARIERFFAGTLKPAPFAFKLGRATDEYACYCPMPPQYSSYIKFWGTRGSNPVSGPDYIRHGGNTCCLEIRNGEDLIIIDAGTGIRQFGENLIDEEIKTIHLFIGHTHWDHLMGFPFFSPVYKKKCEVIIWAPVGFEKSTKELFNSMLAYSYFPVRLDEMRSKFVFKELRDGKEVSVGSFTINTHYTNHPGPTLCFKVKTPHQTIGYVTDNEVLMGYKGHPSEITIDHPLLEPHLGLIEFLKGCDLLIHEAQYFPHEYPHKVGWGHSSVSNAVAFMKQIGTPLWYVTHHDPSHTDEDLDAKKQMQEEIIEECDANLEICTAYDHLTLPLK